MGAIEIFRDHIIHAEGVLDPEGIHHEFVSGMHGRKLDFDAIPTESRLFQEWVEACAQTIDTLYGGQSVGRRKALLSVANGTNRLVRPVAALLDNDFAPLETRKISPKSVELSDETAAYFAEQSPDFVLVVEDVGTRGTTSATAVAAAVRAGAGRVEALNTWQRRSQLEELDALGVTYNSVIIEPMPTMSAPQCATVGPCAQGWQFIPHVQ